MRYALFLILGNNAFAVVIFQNNIFLNMFNFRYLNKMAISIQKWWRGYQSRRYFRKMIKVENQV